MKNIATYIFLLLILVGCQSKIDKGKVNIVRFDDYDIYKNSVSSDSLLNPFLDVISVESGKEIDAASYFNSRPVKVFGPDVKQYLPPLDSVENVIYVATTNAEKLGIDMAHKAFCGVINPYYQPILISDSIVYIGLNHYLGENYQGYQSFPKYVIKDKCIDRLPVDVCYSAISYCYPFSRDSEEYVVNHILYEGALAYLICEILPEEDIFNLLGYDKNQSEWIKQNELSLWNEIAMKQLLFSRDNLDINKLCQPSPSSMLLDQNCPPLVGRYIGYQIVCSYLNNNKISDLHFLLSKEFYMNENTLILSKYSPK